MNANPVPTESHPDPDQDVASLRDQFAMAALKSPWVSRFQNASTVAEAAYLIADTMLAARKNKTP